ncbi:MAG: hypothetical protein JW852_04995 [Spirochaetales bacterium]|nr:hypothetical protein [Spirochaetales bacterium]
MNAANAAEEFRWGVRAFHNALYGEAVRAFERALAFTPDDYSIQQWLGDAYYRSGYEETALSVWDAILGSGEGTPLLRNQVDTLRSRRGLGDELAEDVRYVNAFSLSGEQDGFTLFSRPASVFPRDDGSFYLTSFAGNQVLRFSANGALKQRILGGIQGLDHPFDVLEIPGEFLFISEFLGNSIVRTNTSGTDIVRFGKKGTGDGELIGPQFLAAGDRGYIFVAETGNRRISKFDYDGNFILSFGKKSGEFKGFKSPTGICVHADKVYVADALDKVIHVFDQSGNYLDSIGDGELSGPEGLSAYSEGKLLVADGKRILTYDIYGERFSLLSTLDGEGMRLTKAVTDVNGDLVVADFTGNSVTMLTDVANIYTGLFVQVRRVLSDDFPKVYLELSVEDKSGNPYLGLDEGNFIISESRGRVTDDSFLLPPEAERPYIALMVDSASGTQAYRETIAEAVSRIYRWITEQDGLISLVSGGEQPAKEGTISLGEQRFVTTAVDAGSYTGSNRFSLALRLAASEVIAWPGQSAVVFITDGELGDLAFDDYGLETSAGYLRNNGVAFFCVYLKAPLERPDELEYLCDSTGGASAYLYRKEGLSPLLDELYARKTGRYFFSYESVRDPQFGDRYLSVEAEVFHFKRSGRAESGYFAPKE